jgi:hypothetical protein
MTPGFVISFGGLIAVVIATLVAEQLLIRHQNKSRKAPSANAEVMASLERAEIAVKEIEAELASARQRLRAG